MRGKGILLNDAYDLQVEPLRDGTGKIVSGILVGDSLFQNQALILVCQPGEIKEEPLLGVGIEDMILDNDYAHWRRSITLNMERDQQTVRNIKFSNSQQLVIDANYR